MKSAYSLFLATMMALFLVACGRAEQMVDGEDIPVDQLPRVEQPRQFSRCQAREYYNRTELSSSANQVAISATGTGWVVATSAATLYRDEPVRIHRFGGPSSGEDERSVVNAGLWQFVLSGYGNNLLLGGYGHKEGERPKPVVEVFTVDSGKQLSLESWQPGVVAADPFGYGYVYAATYTRESGMWAQLGSIEPDGVRTINFDSPVGAQFQCAFVGGVVANTRGDIAATLVVGDFTSRKYEILFLIYSRQSGRWSRATLGSYGAPEIAQGECRPEASVRPLGIFATAAGGWQMLWVDANGLKLADINGQAVTQRQLTIDLPPGTSVLAPAVQVPNGYLLALRGAPTARLAATVGAAFVRSTGEVVAYQPFTFGEVLAPTRIGQLYQAATAALAAAKNGRTAALAYVAKGGQARVLFFSNDCGE